MAGILGDPQPGILGWRTMANIISPRLSFADLYPGVGMDTPPLPSYDERSDAQKEALLREMFPNLAPFQLVKGLGMGVADTFKQANQAMPWGGNDPSAIGIDPQAGTMDPSVMVPFASNLAGMAATGGIVSPKPAGALGIFGGRLARTADQSAPVAQTGIRAWHGSPHDFPPVRHIRMPDGTELYQNMHELPETPAGATILKEYPLGRFDMSKIGTGEGAQAYGHGLYFAENEGVARSYRDALTGAPPTIKLDGNEFSYIGAGKRDLMKALMEKGASDVEAVVAVNALQEAQGALPAAARALREGGGPKAEVAKYIDMMTNDKPEGRMYEVDINASPDEFLDWDKPLSEQSAKVREALKGVVSEDDIAQDIPGQLVVYRTGGKKLNSPEGAEALRAAGIKGIRYRDAGSRTPLPDDALVQTAVDLDRRIANAEREIAAMPPNLAQDYQQEIARLRKERAAVQKKLEPTSNYVVFDDNIIEILNKYGLAGLMAGGAGAAMLGGGSDPASASAPKYTTGGRF